MAFRVAILIILTLSSCSPIAATEQHVPSYVEPDQASNSILPTSQPLPRELDEFYLPAYYPESYSEAVNSSKSEQGLVIYSALPESAWEPVIATFQGHYPWITVTASELGANEVFERYNSDLASGVRTADLVASYSPDGWLTFANSGTIDPYVSVEDLFIPPWAKLAPGIYTFSSDPMVIAYDKNVISDPPQSISDLINYLEISPTSPNNRLTIYDANQNSTGFAVYWYLIKMLQQTGWDALDKIGKADPVLRSSASSMVTSINDQEASLGLFVTPIAFLQEEDNNRIGWNYIKDAQPVLMRSIAVTKQAASPNSARLFLDFLMSQDGQLSLAYGWMTPFRSDIANVDIFKDTGTGPSHIHFDQVIEAVGLNNLIFMELDPEITKPENRETFLDRWNLAINH